MSTFHIRKKLDSDTVTLPEIRPLIGKTVEIIVHEVTMPDFIPGTGDWDAVENAVRGIKDFDYEALAAQEECDLNHAKAQLP